MSGLLTFLPMDEVRRLGALEGSKINEAKRVLAYEVTKNVHGEAEAMKAQQAAEALFVGGALAGSVPTTHITEAQLDEDARVTTWAVNCGLCKSRGEARKTVEGGGLYIGDEKVSDVNIRSLGLNCRARAYCCARAKRAITSWWRPSEAVQDGTRTGRRRGYNQ